MTKSAVITGGGSGIGLALANKLSQRGYAVVLVGRSEPKLQEAASAINARGGTAVPIVTDVRDPEAMKDVVTRTLDLSGQIDLFFNNAGIGMAGEMDEYTTAHWDRIIDINVKGVINGVMAAYPVMVSQGSGHIINVASLAGLCPSPLMVPYSATKHAVVGLSLALRPEAAAKGVRVSVVCPGYVDTPLLDRVVVEDLPPSRLAESVSFREEASRTRPPYSPDLLAERILADADKNKPVIIAPKGLYALWVVYRLFPRLFDRLAPRNVTRIRQQAKAAEMGISRVTAAETSR